MAEPVDTIKLPQEIFDNMEAVAQRAEMIELLDMHEGRETPEKDFKTPTDTSPQPMLSQTEKGLYRILGNEFFKGAQEVLALLKRDAAFKERMHWRSKKVLAYWDLVRRPVVDMAQSGIVQNLIKFSV